MMKKAKKFLEVSKQQSETVAGLAVPELRQGEATMYNIFALRGIRVDRIEPGLVVCTFKVPLRLLDRNGKFASGAIANLVDVVGSCVIFVSGAPMNVTVEMSISYLSTAKLNDELEITSRLLGQKGGYSGTIVLMRNKVTGEIISEGRHSLFRSRRVYGKL
ncbi:uncharacterized protein LOC126787614 [Argentina anserina]|uniref:uncharacterized protein LOC126787614 n=1 Tax=Argentina anserina TaxID=57926 RepID=UPI0021762603|nr:uncharacterized protein LOC126787614 [Potentilla anserina]